MVPTVVRLQLCFALTVAALLMPRAAADGGDPRGHVEVDRVDFERVPGPGGSWYAAVVRVVVTPAGQGDAFVDRVRVALNLGFELGSLGAKRFEFYRSTATAVSARRGRASFRFYLPPEIVERDRLRGDARYYLIELAADGEPMPLNRRHVSPGLPTPEALAAFRARVAAEAASNDGVLVAQPDSPFAVAFGGPPAPTFVSSP